MAHSTAEAPTGHNLTVKQIRENIFQITYTELGKPQAKGPVILQSLGEVMLDEADIRYAHTSETQGYEPVFFVSRSEPLFGRYVVVGRQEKA
jgi:hypothetical protein